MNILVVEDDEQLAELLERVFRGEGHSATLCGSLRAAKDVLASSSFDVAVLDWMLPDGEGIDLCERLRDRSPPLPTLILTARNETQDRITGLRRGADDYLAKPFDVGELLARIDAIHRRGLHSWVLTFGGITIDHRAQVVVASGRHLDLTTREFRLLACLADRPNECVPRADLLLRVWNLTFDPGSGLIDVHVSRLRDKLAEHAWMVETVRGRGLRFRTEP